MLYHGTHHVLAYWERDTQWLRTIEWRRVYFIDTSNICGKLRCVVGSWTYFRTVSGKDQHIYSILFTYKVRQIQNGHDDDHADVIVWLLWKILIFVLGFILPISCQGNFLKFMFSALHWRITMTAAWICLPITVDGPQMQTLHAHYDEAHHASVGNIRFGEIPIYSVHSLLCLTIIFYLTDMKIRLYIHRYTA